MHVTPRKWRLSVLTLSDAINKWNILENELSLQILPILTTPVICFLVAAPTVAVPKKENGKYYTYSTTEQRARLFTGNKFSKKTIRYIIAETGWILLYGRCKHSMTGGNLYKSFLLVKLPSIAKSITLSELRDSMFMFCSCKNSEAAGNCAHIASLLIRVFELQHEVKYAKTPTCDKVRSTIESTKCSQK